MMAPKHTPGPWARIGARVYTASPDVEDDPISIADCDMDVRIDHDSEGIANARLIAAAPELYAALLKAREFVEAELEMRGDVDAHYPIKAEDLLAEIDVVLAKAEGRE